MREKKPTPQGEIAEENTEGRKQIKGNITSWVFPGASKLWLFCAGTCWIEGRACSSQNCLSLCASVSPSIKQKYFPKSQVNS